MFEEVLTVVAAAGAGVAAGVFFAFSAFVMRALAGLSADKGISAMQAINREAPTRWLMTELLGTAALCLALTVVAFLRMGDSVSAYLLTGSALYLAGIVLTRTYHVPRNNELDLVDPDSRSAAGAWSGYLSPWTTANHVRTVTSLAAAVAFTLALRVV